MWLLECSGSAGDTSLVLTAITNTAQASPLARFVEDVRALAPVDGHARHHWLPDGRTSLVFRVLDDGRQGDVSLAGPRTRARIKELSGVTRAVIVRFKPGWAAPLFGVAANEVTDRIVPLEALWGYAGADLYGRLVEAEDVTKWLDCVSGVLVRRAQRSFESSSARLARRAARRFEEGEARVDRVAAQLGVTARHLRRTFTEHVGVGPKDYARSFRLQHAIRLAASSNDWSCIARQAGYFDQAHLIADFRQLMGVTPGVFATRAREADVRCS